MTGQNSRTERSEMDLEIVDLDVQMKLIEKQAHEDKSEFEKKERELCLKDHEMKLDFSRQEQELRLESAKNEQELKLESAKKEQ